MSSPFVRVRDKEASLGLDVRSKTITLRVYNVTSLILRLKYVPSQRKEREKLEKCATTIQSTVIFVL